MSAAESATLGAPLAARGTSGVGATEAYAATTVLVALADGAVEEALRRLASHARQLPPWYLGARLLLADVNQAMTSAGAAAAAQGRTGKRGKQSEHAATCRCWWGRSNKGTPKTPHPKLPFRGDRPPRRILLQNRKTAARLCHSALAHAQVAGVRVAVAMQPRPGLISPVPHARAWQSQIPRVYAWLRAPGETPLNGYLPNARATLTQFRPRWRNANSAATGPTR